MVQGDALKYLGTYISYALNSDVEGKKIQIFLNKIPGIQFQCATYTVTIWLNGTRENEGLGSRYNLSHS